MTRHHSTPDSSTPVIYPDAVEEAALALMQDRGGPGEPMRHEATVAITTYLRYVHAFHPSSTEAGDTARLETRHVREIMWALRNPQAPFHEAKRERLASMMGRALLPSAPDTARTPEVSDG